MSYMRVIKHRIWTCLGRYCWALPLFEMYRVMTGKKIGVVSKETDIVIEGYPRSANTMAVSAFEMAQKEPVKLAHHVHGAAQVLWAAKNNIPVIVLIRDPGDAVASLIVRGYGISIKEALKNYIRFYRSIMPVKNSCVIARFDDVVSHFDEIVRRVNKKYRTEFAEFVPTKRNMDRCLEVIEEMDRSDQGLREVDESTVARPSASRKILVEEAKKKLAAKHVSGYFDEAESIYEQMFMD